MKFNLLKKPLTACNSLFNEVWDYKILNNELFYNYLNTHNDVKEHLNVFQLLNNLEWKCK